MDRIALSDKLEGISKVFKEESKFAQDLSAMAYVLKNTDDARFASVIAEVEANENVDAAGVGFGQMPMQKGPSAQPGQRSRALNLGPQSQKPFQLSENFVAKLESTFTDPQQQGVIDTIKKNLKKLMPSMDIKPEAAPAKSAAEEEEVVTASEETNENAGMFWNKEASDLIAQNLMKDVLGMDKSICCDTKQKLSPEQVPDGHKKAEKPSSLKPEQTPSVDDVLDSDIVKESNKTPLKKEAGDAKGPGVPDKDGKGPLGGTEECPMSEENKDSDDAAEKKEEKTQDKAEKKEDKAQEMEKGATEEPTVIVAEGIELGPRMDEIELDGEEAQKLSKLFE